MSVCVCTCTSRWLQVKDPDGVLAEVKEDYSEVGGPHPGPAPSHTSSSAEFSMVQDQLKKVQV